MPTKKLKRLNEIQELIANKELATAHKKLLRYQPLFKFKENDEESILYYKILLQFCSSKLFEKFLIKELDLTIVGRKNLNFDTLLKLIITADVFAHRGAYQSSLFILNNIEIKKEHIKGPIQGRLLYMVLCRAYFYNGDLKKSLSALEKYKSFATEKFNLHSYFVLTTVIHCLEGSGELAKKSYVNWTNLEQEETSFWSDYAKLLSFAVPLIEGKGDKNLYREIEIKPDYSLHEDYRVLVHYFQLKYLLHLGDEEKIHAHVKNVNLINMRENTECTFFNDLSGKFFNSSGLNASLTDKFCFEIAQDKVHTNNYFSIAKKDNQLDLVGGVWISGGTILILTELQIKCLYYLIKAEERGMYWLKLSELMYGVNLNTDATFENTRQIVKKLRSLKFSIQYKKGRYFFSNNFHSILLSSDYRISDQLSYLIRCYNKKHFTGADIAECFGLKKSRSSEYARNWVDQKRLTLVSKGKQKVYRLK